MADKVRDVLVLSATDDIAIRSFYTYQLLEELIQAQRKGMLDLASTVVGILAGTIGIIEFVQLPAVSFQIGLATVTIIVVIVIVWFFLRRYFFQKTAQYGGYLGILLDEVLKYGGQLRILDTCEDKSSDFGKWFLKHTIEATRASRKQIDEIKGDMSENELAQVLDEFGFTKERMEKILEETDQLLAKGNGKSNEKT